MDLYAIVRPEHLNHFGYLFGGALLKWVDEFAWIAASNDFPTCHLVTIGFSEVKFKQRVLNGSVLRFSVNKMRKGRSSATYAVDVFARESEAEHETAVFQTSVTFVRVDENGCKMALP